MKRDKRILAFHGLKQKGKICINSSAVSYSNIVRAINEFKLRGYCFKTASEILNDFDEKSIYIYFDDCDESLKTLFESNELPSDFKATLFVISDYIDAKGSWDVIDKKRKSLDNDYIKGLMKKGFEIGSHSKNHNPINVKAESVLIDEIVNSKQDLENIFGTCVNFFSPPFGAINKKAVDMIFQAGYKGIFSVSNSMSLNSDNLYITNPITAFDSWQTIVSKRIDSGFVRFLNDINSCLYNNFSKGSVLLKKFQFS